MSKQYNIETNSMKITKWLGVFLYATILTFCVSSCCKKCDTKIFVVASQRLSTPVELFYWVKEQGYEEWMLVCAPIKGFVYERGYEYEIEIEIRKTKDFVSHQWRTEYTLKRIITKEKKDSDVPFSDI